VAPLDRFRRSTKGGKPSVPAPSTKETGRTGTINSGGFIVADESNRDLIPPNDLSVYREMSRTDSTVRWMLALLKAPILAAEWAYDPPEDATPEELELTAFCQHALFEELNEGFGEMLRKVLRFFEYGHSVFELRAAYRPVEFSYTTKDDKGQKTTHSVKREAFVIDRLGERMQRTIAKWNVEDKDPATLVSIEQWLGDGRGDSSPVTDAERLIVFTLDREGDDFRGTSILRSAWRNYHKKLELENLEAIGIERSFGLPIAYMPGADDAKQASMEDALINLRQQENPYIIVPFPKYDPQHQPNGVLIEFPDLVGTGGVDPDPAIKRHEAAMARNILAEFMRLGHEGEGARSTGETQQDPYWQALDAIVSLVQDVFHRTLTPKLARWNYSEALRLPRLVATKIQAKNVEVVFSALAQGVEKGFIIPDADLEEWARELIDAPYPKRDTDEDPYAKLLDQKLNPPEPTMPPGGGDPAKPAPQKPKPGAPAPAKLSEDWGRPLRSEEMHVAFSDVLETLESGEQRIADTCERMGAAMLAEPLKQAEAAVEHRSPQAAEALSVDHTALADALYGVLRDTYDQGRAHASDEIARQLPAAMAAEKSPPPEPDRVARLRALADNVAASVSAAAMRALRSLTLRRIEHPDQAPTGPGFDPQQTLNAEATRAGRPTVGQAYADGRSDAILSSEYVEKTVYSALLDSRVCEACALADGEENPPGEGTPCPNPDCHGGAACRCVRVPVVSAAKSGRPQEIGPGYVIASERPVNVTVNVPEQPAPVVHAHFEAPTVNVEAPPAPNVTVRQAPAPKVDVKVEPKIEATLATDPKAVKMAEGQAKAQSDVAQGLENVAKAIRAPRTKKIVKDADGRPSEIRERSE
jgi:hypothetical protein